MLMHHFLGIHVNAVLLCSGKETKSTASSQMPREVRQENANLTSRDCFYSWNFHYVTRSLLKVAVKDGFRKILDCESA